MRKYQFWTEKEKQYLRAYGKTTTLQQLARELGRSPSSVYMQMSRMDVARSKKKGAWNGCDDKPENCMRCTELYGYKECKKPAHLCSEENRGYATHAKHAPKGSKQNEEKKVDI